MSLPASANGERVFHQMFLNLVENIFACREATFVSLIKANGSRYCRQGKMTNISATMFLTIGQGFSLAKALARFSLTRASGHPNTETIK
jgi:hypothetical protein